MHPDLLEELLMRSALRGGLPCPSRQPAPFRVADQVVVPSRTTPFGDHPVRVVSAEARSSTPLILVTAPLAVSRIQLRRIVQVIASDVPPHDEPAGDPRPLHGRRPHEPRHIRADVPQHRREPPGTCSSLPTIAARPTRTEGEWITSASRSPRHGHEAAEASHPSPSSSLAPL